MIQLTVTSYNGAPVANLVGSFDEMGGTIGRAPENQLVLPDPERVVSRVHAKVLFRAGAYALVACGGNALLLNDRTVGHGTPVPLAPGDRIQMGGYCLEVGAPGAAAAPDPFDGLFRDAAGGGGAKASPPAPSGHSMPRAPAGAARVAPAGASGGRGVPDDWDPFERSRAELGRAAAPTAGANEPPPVVRQTRREESLDELFGLKPGAADAFAKPAAQANTTSDADPLASLKAGPRQVPPTKPDHESELNAPWTAARGPADPSRAPRAEGAVYSWRSIPGGAHERGDGSAAAERPAVAASPGQGDELLVAFLQGLAVSDLPIDRLTPALLRQAGQMLRASTQGAVELLAIRAAFKRELRAGVTVISGNDNNPLKFSPGADVALRHLLGPPAAGFMPPVDAVRDAFEDLRAHELAVMAGMKAALAGVLERFDPAVLEGRLASRSPLAGLIPSARKARLWNLFEELYRQLAEEAAEDFDTLFGKAFLKAYQQYLQQIEAATAESAARRGP